MAIKFNDFNNGYNNYNFAIGQGASKEAKKAEDTKEVVNSNAAAFKGLENETDLLTKNTQYLYGAQLGKFTKEDLDIADSTNAILASLGYSNYKVSAAQVASVAGGVKNVVMPGMKLAEDGAVAANIQDPDGPFADLFV